MMESSPKLYLKFFLLHSMKKGGFICDMEIHLEKLKKKMQSWKQQPGQATIFKQSTKARKSQER